MVSWAKSGKSESWAEVHAWGGATGLGTGGSHDSQLGHGWEAEAGAAPGVVTWVRAGLAQEEPEGKGHPHSRSLLLPGRER